MSAFLAPVHFWLYNKIGLQEELIDDIIDLASEEGWTADGKNPSEFSGGELPALESVIDTSNIHGWLQARIQDAEKRYAELVTSLLRENPERMTRICRAARTFGEHHGMEAGADPQNAFKALQNSLLDGMPCDRVNALDENSDRRIAWHREQNLHGAFWTEAGGFPSVYDRLRSEIIQGMLAHTDLTYNDLGNDSYEICAA